MISQSQPRHWMSLARPQLSLCWASFIVLMWFVSLAGAFTLPNAQTPVAYLLCGVLIRAFLHTGLFIVAHEAIHNNISNSRRLDDAFGSVAAGLYALLPYQRLAQNHRLHHRFPATDRDPDYQAGDSTNFLTWYVKFMTTYQSGGQVWVSLIGITIIFFALMACQVSIANMMLFWIIPIVISSLQLFTFGIFLPHRQNDSEFKCRHRARSINLPVFWSFITCYHFGYHLEHHLYPHLPWYQLPQAYRANKV
ncbi:beta-carotene ketolase [filamentous cyanobacterium CCT1]|nr:beta-carotene ketolase [filamentous cyanobacterium CCT1]PSN80028.1 beta-carotene ketolase [filamentous cyanobacterium CCP4]